MNLKKKLNLIVIQYGIFHVLRVVQVVVRIENQQFEKKQARLIKQSSWNFGKVVRSKPQFFQSCTQVCSLEKCNFFRVCSQIEIAPGRASCVIGSIRRNFQKLNFYQGYRKVTPLYGILSLSWVEFCCRQLLPATSGIENPRKTNNLAHLKVILALLGKQIGPIWAQRLKNCLKLCNSHTTFFDGV